ncbi:DNA polymerase zeta [Serendipita sp. 401]|nr:DNA polymerase zeta [Serendipita sp. 401]
MSNLSEATPSQEAELRVRINVIDHIMAEPGPLDDPGNAQGIPARRVPVIRIFGDTPTGEKACAHVHQVFPYFYIAYEDSLDPGSVNRYTKRLHFALNAAIAMSLNRNHHTAIGQYVRAIILVKGIPFYGFTAQYSPFLKIMLTTPDQVNRAILILQSGSIMGRKMSVYESHLSYPLQFMCDFNLYGCDWINLNEVHHRKGLEAEGPSSPLYQPVTRMPIEVDVVSYNILNRTKVQARHLHHKLQIPAPKILDEHLVSSVRELWEDEKQRRMSKGLPPTPELPATNAENRPQGGDWVFKEKYEQLLSSRIASEREQEPTIRPSTWEAWVMTTFESVQSLWERPYRTWRPDGINPFNQGEPSTTNEAEAHLELDPSILSSQDFEDETMALRDEGESWAKWLQEQEDPDAFNEEYDDDPENGPPPERQWETPEAGRAPGQPEGMLASKADTLPSSKISAEDHLSTIDTLEGIVGIRESKAPLSSNQSYPGLPLHTHANSNPLDEYPTSPKTKSIVSGMLEAPQPPPIEIEDMFFTPKTKNEAENQNQGTNTDDSYSSALRIAKPKGVRFANYQEPNSSKPSKVVHNENTSFEYSNPPPSTDTLLSGMERLGIPYKDYRDPFYSKLQDIPEHRREFGGLRFHLRRGELNEWDDEPSRASSRESTPVSDGSSHNRESPEPSLIGTGVTGWEFASAPPSKRNVLNWLDTTWRSSASEKQRRAKQSQLEGPTQHGSFVPLPKRREIATEFKSMSIFSLETFAPTHKAAYNPESDEISLISWCFHDGSLLDSDEDRRVHYQSGILMLKGPNFDPRRLRNHRLESFESELDIINALIDEVNHLDPDIICGWEVQSGSWGYLIARANIYGIDAKELLGRAPVKASGGGVNNWSTRHTSTIKVSGRHVLNIWRLMRSELTLDFYTFHNVARHVLKQRFPRYTNASLSEWFASGTPVENSRVISYYVDMASMLLEVLDEIQIVIKTAEFARVFGIDFFSVLSRGSQFKVESFMLRIAKPESFVLISPSRHQVGMQNAAECFPLIMEPISAFYKSPLLVLDFQSLYPSVMVAYNYCYSTCLGRVKDFKGKNKFGVLDDLEVPPGLLEKVKDHIHIAPNGMIYVKPTVRKSLLAKMLTELLDTRVMVKQGMQLAKGNKPLLRVLDARQLSLKFICNVTYGYTSASFSGRMPAVEIADSIVQAGRETLEKAIHMIESTGEWGAKVVYGDTDSLFVYLPGKTKQQAFVIGNKIADAVTASNPAPVKLKFEKVYLPSVLVAKKRYVGFKFEDPDETTPVFDAKGIETVRRDGIPAGQKMMETSLKMLFRSQDLSEVKDYCWRSWTKVLEGRVSIQDFIFAREVRMGTYSDKVAPQPGAAIAAERLAEDPNDETQYGERVRYVITRARPGDRLSDRAVPPALLFDETGRQLDAYYYVTRRLIPPIARIFDLVGADVRAWFDEMPKPQRIEGQGTIGGVQAMETPPRPTMSGKQTPRNQKIDQHFASNLCLVCENVTLETLCTDCQESPESTVYALKTRTQKAEQHMRECQLICASCSGCAPVEEIRCESLECEWLYERVKARKEVQLCHDIPTVIDGLLAKRG